MPALMAGVCLLQCVSCVTTEVDDPRLVRAEAYERVGSWSEAAGLWTQIYFDSGLRDLEAGRLAARASLVAGRPDDALVRLDDLLARTPGDPQLLEMRGCAREELGRPEAARADYEAALAADPDLPRTLSRLGALDVADGNLDQGLDRLVRGVGLDPSDRDAQFGLGVAWASTGQMKLAAEAFGAAFRGEESVAASSLGRRLEAARLLGSDPRCADWLAPLLRAYPQHTEALWRTGQSELAGGRRVDGMAHLARAAESDPGDVPALAAYAAALLLEGRDGDAEAIIEHALGLNLTEAEAALIRGVRVPSAGGSTGDSTGGSTEDSAGDPPGGASQPETVDGAERR